MSPSKNIVYFIDSNGFQECKVMVDAKRNSKVKEEKSKHTAFIKKGCTDGGYSFVKHKLLQGRSIGVTKNSFPKDNVTMTHLPKYSSKNKKLFKTKINNLVLSQKPKHFILWTENPPKASKDIQSWVHSWIKHVYDSSVNNSDIVYMIIDYGIDSLALWHLQLLVWNSKKLVPCQGCVTWNCQWTHP